jgi:hypothetical protein
MKRPEFLRAYIAFAAAIFAFAVLAETGFFTAGHIRWPLALLNLTFLVIALVPVRGYVLVVSVICMAGAILIALFFRVPASELAAALNKSAGIIAFVVVVPAVAIPIRLGGYITAMEAFIARRSSVPEVKKENITGVIVDFLVLAVMHLLMSIVLNIASIPTFQRLLERSRLPKKYLPTIYSAGYSSYMVISPFDGLINAIVLAAGMTYAGYFGRGILMTIAILFVSCIFIFIDRRKPRSIFNTKLSVGYIDKLGTPGFNGNPGLKILELAGHIVAMIFLSWLAGMFIILDNPAIVTAFTILCYSAFWLWLLKINRASLYGQGKEYAAALSGYRAFLPFLVSAGFLGSMTAWTPLADALGTFIASRTVLPRYFTLQAIMLATALLSLLGVHMMITVVAIATALSPAMLGLSEPGFALFLLSCWFVAMNVSPFVPFSTVVAEAIGEKTAVVSLRYNSRMSLVMLLVAPLLMW